MEQQSFKHSFKTTRRSMSSLYVCNVGFQRCEGGYRWGPGRRDHYLIHHIAAGRGTYSVGEETYHLKAGDTFLAYPGTTITYQADWDDPWEYYWIGFSGHEAQGLLRHTDFTPSVPVISVDFGGELQRLLLDTYQKRGQRAPELARMTGGLYSVLACLMEHSAGGGETEQEISSALVDHAVDYISANYCQALTLEDMASAVGTSKSGLYRAFRSRLGVSPIQYLAQVRLHRACSLFCTEELSVEEVACSVGFTDPLYFSRFFKKHTGLSPRAYITDNRGRKNEAPETKGGTQ